MKEVVGREHISRLARECGFELAGVTPAVPHEHSDRFLEWARGGFAAGMGYLTDYRAERRRDPRSLLPSARSVICVGRVYNGPEPRTAAFDPAERAWIARYAWGDDYHEIMREGLERLASKLPSCEYKVCVDTAPLLERSYAAAAGLGWIGKNTCLINKEVGSYLFLGELLVSLELAPDAPVENHCGECMACIDACPTQALAAGWLDSNRCISYLTIEHRGPLPEDIDLGNHVFGCDICQDVCPWNRRAAVTADPRFASRWQAPPLRRLAALTEAEFREMFRHSPVSRARYAGFRRNVEAALRSAA